MNDEAKRRYDDSIWVKALKDFWPLFLGIITFVSMYTRMDSRLSTLEQKDHDVTPVILDNQTRVTRLETVVLNMQGDIRDIKVDVKTILNRTR